MISLASGSLSLQRELLATAVTEIELLRRLQHDNIIAFEDSFLQNKQVSTRAGARERAKEGTRVRPQGVA